MAINKKIRLIMIMALWIASLLLSGCFTNEKVSTKSMLADDQLPLNLVWGLQDSAGNPVKWRDEEVFVDAYSQLLLRNGSSVRSWDGYPVFWNDLNLLIDTVGNQMHPKHQLQVGHRRFHPDRYLKIDYTRIIEHPNLVYIEGGD